MKLINHCCDKETNGETHHHYTYYQPPSKRTIFFFSNGTQFERQLPERVFLNFPGILYGIYFYRSGNFDPQGQLLSAQKISYWDFRIALYDSKKIYLMPLPNISEFDVCKADGAGLGRILRKSDEDFCKEAIRRFWASQFDYFEMSDNLGCFDNFLKFINKWAKEGLTLPENCEVGKEAFFNRCFLYHGKHERSISADFTCIDLKKTIK